MAFQLLKDSILLQNLTDFRLALSKIDISEDLLECPINLIIESCDSPDNLYTISILMLQDLINAQVPFKHIKCDEHNSLHPGCTKARVIRHLKNTKPYIKISNRLQHHHKVVSDSVINSNNKSNYSTQELFQLKQIAHELGIRVVTNNHLALKIIDELKKKK